MAENKGSSAELVRQLSDALERAHHAQVQLMDANVRTVDAFGPLLDKALAEAERAARYRIALEAIAEGRIQPDVVQQHARAAIDEGGKR